MSNIELKEAGRRLYIVGNSDPIKAEIKAAGGHWDADQRAWWIGTGKREEIQRALDGVFAGPPRPSGFPSGLDTKVKGKVRYNGKLYAFSFACETKLGSAYKLHFADGSKDFWAKHEECELVKTYREPITLGKLEQLREEYKKPDNGPTKRCWECGGTFTYRDAKQNGGDWQDKFLLIKSIAPSASLNMRSPGDWCVLAGMEHRHGVKMLIGDYGNGSTPRVAVEAHWKLYTDGRPLFVGGKWHAWNGAYFAETIRP